MHVNICESKYLISIFIKEDLHQNIKITMNNTLPPNYTENEIFFGMKWHFSEVKKY